MKPDPAKVTAIVEMPVPQDQAAVRRLLGMINFLASHIPNMASITTPLRELAENALNQIKTFCLHSLFCTSLIRQSPMSFKLMQVSMVWVCACFKRVNPLPMHHTVCLNLNGTMPRLRRNYLQICLHVPSFTSTFMDSSQRCRQITSHLR